MLRWLLLALAVCGAVPAAACDTGPFKIFYHPGSARLSETDKRLLDVMKLVAREDGFIRLSGHTDTAGPAKDNLSLARRRVEGARAFLVGLGMPAGRILIESFGEGRSISALDDGSPSWKHRYFAGRARVGRGSAQGQSGPGQHDLRRLSAAAFGLRLSLAGKRFRESARADARSPRRR